jgi:hypothetical protein
MAFSQKMPNSLGNVRAAIHKSATWFYWPKANETGGGVAPMNPQVPHWVKPARSDFLHLANEPLFVRELASFQFGVDPLSIDIDLKAAATRWDHLQ